MPKLVGAPVSDVAPYGDEIAVLALPYADDTAVPMEENWPLTACAVDAIEPETPAAPVAMDDVAPAVRVGQIDVRVPGVDVQPTIETTDPPIARTQRNCPSWIRLADLLNALRNPGDSTSV